MNSAEIAHAITNDVCLNKLCIGVFPSDKLPSIPMQPCCFVANEDPAKKEGSHWVSFYVVGDGRCEFFDSYGRPPQNKNFVSFLRPYTPVWSTKQVQGLLSTACGQHSLHYLFNRSRGIPYADITNLYSKDLKDNDESVCAFVNEMFDLSNPVTDDEFLRSQISRQFYP